MRWNHYHTAASHDSNVNRKFFPNVNYAAHASFNLLDFVEMAAPYKLGANMKFYLPRKEVSCNLLSS